ncbi:DUF6379 domain-containing protein [Paenibacillus sp. MMS20-IR301]|uniref:C-glycoside deglycosidase beta subunit domain-containing protein n=1 Tax=Paenibacillus sp. MMS20-IR301 TaxID=2895946 RepID=UPI0028E38884|nr:DUF6379 domain-containing protein [Paenibacillus sp. MMS20-IR301]WNS43985.1 DUF6379 domain-containing protein [Paenibacillus sp. MMS20-IR301]
MFDKECIQSRGFKNSKDAAGRTTGFQLTIRSLYYRGVWLSQLRPAVITVDGETFSGEQITWTINGVTYTQGEMASLGNIHWGVLDPAVFTVVKAGGLSSGPHDIELSYTYSCSYFPPSLDTVLGMKPQKRTLVLV